MQTHEPAYSLSSVTAALRRASAFISVDPKAPPRKMNQKAVRIFRYLDIAGYVFSMIIVLWMYSVHVRSIFQYPYFAPSANVEELAYTHLSSTNFNNFGFLATKFLQDFSASPYPSDHPYVYDHMPPGPDIARALVMRITGGRFAWTAIIFASFVPLGFVFYFMFLHTVLRDRFVLGGVFLFLLTPWTQYIPHFSNPIWNAALLLIFAPLVTLHWSYQHKQSWPFFLIGLPLILTSALYLDYVVLSSVLGCWVALYFLQVIRLHKREFMLAIGAIAFGIILNLLKNLIYFGPSLFAEELFYVLANRISGWPSQQALASFYTEHGILHHGARPPHASVLWNVIKLNLHFDGLYYFLIAAAASLLLTLDVRVQAQKKTISFIPTFKTIYDCKLIVRIVLFVVVILVTPIVLFPAFAQEVNLYGGTNYIWLGLMAIVLASIASTRVIEVVFPTIQIWWRTGSVFFRIPATHKIATKMALTGMVAAFVAALLIEKTPSAVDKILSTVSEVRSNYAQNQNIELERLRDFAAAPFMTNINIPTVYFYTGSVGFGVCGLDSVSENGKLNLDGCKIMLVRDRSLYADAHPSYFFLFKIASYFPGFADCGPPSFIQAEEQLLRAPAGCFEIQKSRLNKYFYRVLDTKLFTVYDLRKSPP